MQIVFLGKTIIVENPMHDLFVILCYCYRLVMNRRGTEKLMFIQFVSLFLKLGKYLRRSFKRNI